MGKDKAFGLAIVETRSLPNLVEVIQNHIKYTGCGELTIFCHDNESFLRRYFPDANFCNLRMHLTETHYNYMLASELFWKAIPYEKVLIFQHDSWILKSIEKEFMNFDYIGSPWRFSPYVGNGGFSIRSKEAMLKTIDKVKYNPSLHGNEDVYFCNHLQGKLAPIEVAEKFCVESIFKLHTFAFHAIEKYLTKEQILQIKNQYK